MPEFSLSLPGVFVAGNAGDGGVVSTNGGKVVIGPNAGNAHFLNGVEFVCQSYGPHLPKLVAVNVLTGAIRDLLLDGVNKIVAGADHWFAVTMHTGVLLDGFPVNYSVRAFAGPYMAWFPWNGTGLIRRGPDGDVTLSDALGPEDSIQLFPDGGVVWAEAGRVMSYGVSGFPVNTATVPGGFGWVKAFRVGSVWWLAYQSYALASVVAHPATELIGYRWPAPNAFRLDATMIAGRPRLIWSRSDADSPADIELHDLDLSLARVDLSGVPAPPPPPPPPPPPKKEPPVSINHLDTLQRVRAKYPAKIDASQAVAILNETAWEHRDEGLGLLRKDGGNHGPQPTTGILCSCDWIVNSKTGNGGDCLVSGPDSTIGELNVATPTWNDGEPFDQSRFVKPVAPDGVVKPGPNPPPSGSPGAELDAELTHFRQQIAALSAMCAAQQAEIAALKARPVGGNVTGLADGAVIALKSHTDGRGYLTAEPSGTVEASNPDRPFGDYQLFTIEVQQ